MELAFRTARLEDVPALGEVVGHEPSDEQLAMAGGDPRRASRFRDVVMAPISAPSALPRTVVAVSGGEVVGLMQTGAEGAGLTAGLAWRLLRVFGPFGIAGFVRRDRLRARVFIPAPAEAFHVVELHVAKSHRNSGIGAALLGEAERMARAQGARRMSLTTTTSNPARHLYERSGFVVVKTTSDAEYLALTGIEGRILMVKELD